MQIGSMILDAHFFTSLGSIVLIDLLLAGDNAVVIAMAVRGLPVEQRKKGIILGALAAVMLRVILTFFVSQLLQVQFVKLVGGVLILWIALKLFGGDEGDEVEGHSPASIWDAMKLIVIADITMSLDNMLAVGGASHGNLFLLIFGLALSIPFIVFTSNLLSRIMDRFPVVVYLGAAILGKVGAEMILTDPFTRRFIDLSPGMIHLAEAVLAAAVVVGGIVLTRRRERGAEKAIPAERAGVGGSGGGH
jgi:YjbE family integral membrane protein